MPASTQTLPSPTTTNYPNGVKSGFGLAGTNSLIPASGNIVAQVNGTAVQPATTAADVVVAVATVPANVFDQLGRGLNIFAAGTTASNVNSKTAKIIVNPTTATIGQAVSGGTTIASTGVVNTTGAAGGWQLEANIYKYGAARSNTQITVHASAQSGNVVGSLTAPNALTLNESAAITIAVTINAATAASDMSLSLLELFAMN
jgi:hypothetical protein